MSHQFLLKRVEEQVTKVVSEDDCMFLSTKTRIYFLKFYNMGDLQWVFPKPDNSYTIQMVYGINVGKKTCVAIVERDEEPKRIALFLDKMTGNLQRIDTKVTKMNYIGLLSPSILSPNSDTMYITEWNRNIYFMTSPRYDRIRFKGQLGVGADIKVCNKYGLVAYISLDYDASTQPGKMKLVIQRYMEEGFIKICAVPNVVTFDMTEEYLYFIQKSERNLSCRYTKTDFFETFDPKIFGIQTLNNLPDIDIGVGIDKIDKISIYGANDTFSISLKEDEMFFIKVFHSLTNTNLISKYTLPREVEFVFMTNGYVIIMDEEWIWYRHPLLSDKSKTRLKQVMRWRAETMLGYL